MDPALIYMKTESCPYKVKALDTGCARIDHKHVAALVVHDLEDMGMSAHEDVRTKLIDEFSSILVILAGISADMGHEYPHPLSLEALVDRVVEDEIALVAVPDDSDRGLEGSNLGYGLIATTEVSRMPDLVDRLEEFPERFLEYTVGV